MYRMMSSFLGGAGSEPPIGGSSSLPQLVQELPGKLGLNGLLTQHGAHLKSEEDGTADDDRSSDSMYKMLEAVCGRVSTMRMADHAAEE